MQIISYLQQRASAKKMFTTFTSVNQKIKTTNPCRRMIPCAASLLLALLFFSNGYAGTITSNAAGGVFSTAGTWVGGIAPIAGDDVIIDGPVTMTAATPVLASLTINATKTFTVSQDVTCSSIIINGTLSFSGITARTLTVNGNATIGATGTLNNVSVTAITFNMIVKGTQFTVNGIFNGVAALVTRIITVDCNSTASITVGDGGSFTVGGNIINLVNLTVGAGVSSTAVFQFNAYTTARTVTLSGAVLINKNGSIASAGVAVNTLTVAGNVTNYGTFTGASGAAGTQIVNLACNTGNFVIGNGINAASFTPGTTTSCVDLTVANAATLQFPALVVRGFTVYGNVDINNGGTIAAGTSGTVIHFLTMSGASKTFTNSGTFTGTNSTSVASITLTNTTGNIVLGDGTNTSTFVAGTISCTDITVNNAATLQFPANISKGITASGNVSINNGGTIATAASGTIIHFLTLSGIGKTFTNNGTFTGTNSTSVASVTITNTNGNVAIGNGATYITGNTSCINLTVGAGASGSLQYPTNVVKTITASGNLTINAGASISAGASGSFTHSLAVGGIFVNNGSFTGIIGSNLVNINLGGGAGNSIITFPDAASSATANYTLYRVTVNKTNASDTIRFNPGSNPNFIFATNINAGLVVTKGVLAITDAITTNFDLFSVAAAGGFYLNNSGASVTAYTNASSAGSFQINDGSFNADTSANTTFSLSGASSKFIMNGGALTASSRIVATSLNSYTQTGGTVTVNTKGNTDAGERTFKLTGGTLNMIGGIIVIQTQCNNQNDWEVTPSIYNFTGFTVQYGNSLTPPGGTNFSIANVAGNKSPSITTYGGASNPITVFSTTNIPVYGDITINGADNLRGTFTIYGNFSSPGNLTVNNTAGFVAGADVIFAGAVGTQTIAGSNTNFTIPIMEIVNANGVTVSTPFTVSGQLNLGLGIVNNGTNTITVSNTSPGAVIWSGFYTEFVNGILAWTQSGTGGDSYFYPMGAGSNFNPVRITNPASGAGANTFAVRYYNAVYPTTSMATVGYHASKTEYWDVNRSSGSSPVDISLITGNSTNSGITDISTMEVGHFNGSQWDAMGNNAGNIAYGASGSEIVSTGINSFSPFTFASNSLLNTLPVNFIAFSANILGNSVGLSWKTAAETNNDYFTVERSADGNNWETVTTVKGAGNSSTLKTYNALDTDPYTGVSYYRIRQTDLGGGSKLSATKAVKLVKVKEGQLLLYPNPAVNQLTIKADANSIKTVKVYNMAGQDMSSLVKIINRSNTSIVLDLSGLARGAYSIQTNTTTAKLFKQ